MSIFDIRSKSELWEEINILVEQTHFTDLDKSLFLDLIKAWGKKV